MMNRKYALLLNGVVLSGVVLGNALPAFALGESSPLSFQGNGSRIIDMGRPSAVLPVSIMAENLSARANTTSSVNYSNTNLSASATTSDYGFSGSIDASGYNTAWRSGGYFHDEVAFNQVNSGTYSIDFIFNVNANTRLFSEVGRTDLAMTLSYWDGRSYTSLDTKYLLSARGSNINRGVSGEYQLSLTGINRSNLIESANTTFLPYTIGLWGSAVNGAISWSNIVLTDVIVKDSAGVILNPDAYALHSDSLAFNAVSAVPLPSTIGLLGVACAGLAALRRKKYKQLSRVDAKAGPYLQGHLTGN